MVSSPDAQYLLDQSFAKAVTRGLLLNKRMRVPSFEMVFVNIEDIVQGEERFLAEMKANMLEGIEVGILHSLLRIYILHNLSTFYVLKTKISCQLQITDNEKYAHDLFFIGPIYHKKFLQLDR